MTHYDIITSLIGPISPIGDESVDFVRRKNLLMLTDLTNRLLDDIYSQIEAEDDFRDSIKESGRIAREFFEDLQEQFTI